MLATLHNAEARCGTTLLDPAPYLCDAQNCHGAKDGRRLYFDDDHLSERGNRLPPPMFAPPQIASCPAPGFLLSKPQGRVAEWFKAAVLKTGEVEVNF